jgi:RNA polymerase sigma-70 factor (ECF subfamily)
MTDPDHDLRRRLARDPDAALADLIDRFGDGVFSGLVRLTGSSTVAEDLTQECFLAALQALRRMAPGALRQLRLGPWIWTIALNRLRNHARTGKRRPTTAPLSVDVASAQSGPEDRVIARAELRALMDSLDRLPAPMRTALVLRYIADLSFEEMSLVLQRRESTLRSDVHRGLRTLRQQWTKEVA